MWRQVLNLVLHYKAFIGLLGFLGLISCSRNEQLVQYDCKDWSSAESCGSGCVAKPTYKYSFLVNKEERSVLLVGYVDGKQAVSGVYKDCVIFNDRHWDCSSIKEFDADTIKMTNGIYIAKLQRRSREIFGDNPGCSK
jgi:hypothetical protein